MKLGAAEIFQAPESRDFAAPRLLAADDAEAWAASPYSSLWRVDRARASVEIVASTDVLARERVTGIAMSARWLCVGSPAGLSVLDRVARTWRAKPLESRSITGLAIDGDRACFGIAGEALGVIDLLTLELSVLAAPRSGDLSCTASFDGALWCGFDEADQALFRIDAREGSSALVEIGAYARCLCSMKLGRKPTLLVGTCYGVRRVWQHGYVAPERFCPEIQVLMHAIATVGPALCFGAGDGVWMTPRTGLGGPAQRVAALDRHVIALAGEKRFVWYSVESAGLHVAEIAAE